MEEVHRHAHGWQSLRQVGSRRLAPQYTAARRELHAQGAWSPPRPADLSEVGRRGPRENASWSRTRATGPGVENEYRNGCAVAEQGERVGQIPLETDPSLWRRRKYLEHLGTSRCVQVAPWERNTRYPGRSRTVPPRG